MIIASSPHAKYFYAPPEGNLGSIELVVYDESKPFTFDVFSIGTVFLVTSLYGGSLLFHLEPKIFVVVRVLY